MRTTLKLKKLAHEIAAILDEQIAVVVQAREISGAVEQFWQHELGAAIELPSGSDDAELEEFQYVELDSAELAASMNSGSGKDWDAALLAAYSLQLGRVDPSAPSHVAMLIKSRTIWRLFQSG